MFKIFAKTRQSWLLDEIYFVEWQYEFVNDLQKINIGISAQQIA